MDTTFCPFFCRSGCVFVCVAVRRDRCQVRQRPRTVGWQQGNAIDLCPRPNVITIFALFFPLYFFLRFSAGPAGRSGCVRGPRPRHLRAATIARDPKPLVDHVLFWVRGHPVFHFPSLPVFFFPLLPFVFSFLFSVAVCVPAAVAAALYSCGLTYVR